MDHLDGAAEDHDEMSSSDFADPEPAFPPPEWAAGLVEQAKRLVGPHQELSPFFSHAFRPQVTRMCDPFRLRPRPRKASAVPKRGRSKRCRRRNTQMRANERKRKSAKECKRAQKCTKERKRALLRKNCKQPG